MGLDITAYKNLKIVKNPVLDDDGYPKDYHNQVMFGESMVWSEKHFPGRGEGLKPDKVYEWEGSYSFCAGNYSYYNLWRNKLDELRNGHEWAFEELINFADNEGVIGGKVAKKLKEDFQIFKNEAELFSKTFDGGEDWLEGYSEWMEALEFASDNGAIMFH